MNLIKRYKLAKILEKRGHIAFEIAKRKKSIAKELMDIDALKGFSMYNESDRFFAHARLLFSQSTTLYTQNTVTLLKFTTFCWGVVVVLNIIRLICKYG